MSRNIDAIFPLGVDAFPNLFEVSFLSLPTAITLGIDENIGLRVKTVNIPMSSLTTYDIHYKTQKFTRFASKVTTSNEMSVTFRADGQMAYYNAFVAWKNSILNPFTGDQGLDSDLGLLRGTIQVKNLNNNKSYVFVGVAPKTVTELSFDYNNDQPIDVTVSFDFFKMNELSV